MSSKAVAAGVETACTSGIRFEAMASIDMRFLAAKSVIRDLYRLSQKTPSGWKKTTNRRLFSTEKVMLLWMHTVKAIYPGTFDPLTNGHLDLIARGSKIVDELVVAILRNSEKGTPLFTVPEREEMLFEATRGFGNVSVTTFKGLLVVFAREQGAKAVLLGIRAI